MSWIVIAIAGHLLNAVAFIVDKTLLSSAFKRSGTYAAVIGLFSALVVVLSPWIDAWPDVGTWIAIAVFGITFVLATWEFFEALSRAETSRVVPVIGTLIPIFTLVGAMIFVNERLTLLVLLGFLLLIGATVLLTRGGKTGQRIDRKTLLICVASAFLFAASTVAGKFAFEHTTFITAFVLSRLFAAGMALLIPVVSKPVRLELLSLIRPKSKAHGKQSMQKAGLMVFGQACGALGFVGVQYAVSLGSATIVNALQAVQYAAIVIVAWFGGSKLTKLLNEEKTPKIFVQKSIAIALVAIGLALVSWQPPLIPSRWGLTWSMPYARELGIDGWKGYERALKEFQPAHVRVIAYWSEIEKQRSVYDFTELDWQIRMAEYYGTAVTVAVGARLPRWPECWVPGWTINLSNGERQDAQMKYVMAVYEHVKDSPYVVAWQVENEPELSSFQTCPGLTKELAIKEMRWIREQERMRGDIARPVGTTDSGELSWWLHFSGETDRLGVSVYRVVLNPLFGKIYWIVPADFYAVKAALVRMWTGEIYVSEFQMEPWSNQSLTKTPIQDQVEQMSLAQMKKNFDYATRLRMPAVDFWGAEWWLWMETQGHPEYWEMAKEFLVSRSLTGFPIGD